MARNCRALSLVVVVCAAAGCPKKRAADPRVECFEATAGNTSAQAHALFDARRCQGGGVTWAAILGALARRHGRVVPVEEETSRWTGSQYSLDGTARFAIDEEGDGAIFCSDDAQLLAAMRREQAKVNGDRGELERAMAQASAEEMECFAADGAAPPLPKMNAMPTPPAGELASVRAQQERFKQTISRQPVWCFPPNDAEDRKGVLRFAADGTATLSGADGKVVQRGRWQLPPPQSGDSRANVLLQGAKGGTLLHLDVGPTGRLGELIPGDECLRAR